MLLNDLIFLLLDTIYVCHITIKAQTYIKGTVVTFAVEASMKSIASILEEIYN